MPAVRLRCSERASSVRRDAKRLRRAGVFCSLGGTGVLFGFRRCNPSFCRAALPVAVMLVLLLVGRTRRHGTVKETVSGRLLRNSRDFARMAAGRRFDCGRSRFDVALRRRYDLNRIPRFRRNPNNRIVRLHFVRMAAGRYLRSFSVFSPFLRRPFGTARRVR